MTLDAIKKKKLPDSPGVYFFTKGQKILYIGKATSLRDRVRSYFSKDIAETRGPLIVKMLSLATGVKTIPTDSVLEALLLEVRLIKTHQPHYNSQDKDDKSFNHIVITNEDFPKVLLVRQREVEQKGRGEYREVFGPFPHGGSLKEAFKIIRKIFPFRDAKCSPASISQKTLRIENTLKKDGRLFSSSTARDGKEIVVGKPCFNRQIGLCPGVCTGEISQAEYAKVIKRISLFLGGKKKALLSRLEKEMKAYAKKQEFEKAGEIKRQIFALRHIQDVALIKHSTNYPLPTTNFRIEAYDVAHISGKFTVGVMTVIENGVAKKSDYRKFKVRAEKGGDVGALKEILSRRLSHPEWPYPSLLVLDGGVAQLHAGEDIVRLFNLSISIVNVVKDEHHKPRGLLGDRESIRLHGKDILLANSEAHRFAVLYHKFLRGREYRG